MVCVEVDGWLWADGLVAFVTVVMGDEDGLVMFAAFATVVMGIEVESSFWVLFISRGGGIWHSR